MPCVIVLNVPYKPLMLGVTVLSVVMLIVMAPTIPRIAKLFLDFLHSKVVRLTSTFLKECKPNRSYAIGLTWVGYSPYPQRLDLVESI